MSDLDQLREMDVRVRQPAFEHIVATRRRRTRRTRAAIASALSGALVLVAVAVASLGQTDRGAPEPVAPTPVPTPTESFVVPSGQETLVPDIAPGDVAGFDVLATLRSTQPEHAGDAVLSVTLPDQGVLMSSYCRGAADLYAFTDIDDGGGGFGPCDPDAPTTFTPDADLTDTSVHDSSDGSRTVRMWLARPSRAFLDCQESGRGDCPRAEDVPPVTAPDAEFGFRLYATPDVRPVLRLPLAEENGEPFHLRALVTVDGVPWLLDRAVVASPRAPRLAVSLPVSDHARLVDVYADDGIHRERCRTSHADELPAYETTDSHVYAAAVDRLCGVDLRLVVDGRRVEPTDDPRADGHVQELGAVLAPREAHRVEVEVVRGDPSDVRYAVVVRDRTDMP